MKVVALVPMKLNNRRLPNKNTKPFTNGKPLCHYILSTLLKVKEIDEIYVYTINEGILFLIDLSFGCTELLGRQYYE